MSSALFVALTLALATANTRYPENYVQTPGGWKIHKDCIYEVPNGAHVEMEMEPKRCPYAAMAPDVQIYAIDTYFGTANQLVTQMNTSWVVPALPVNESTQVVYFWPGFKSQQPVMNYPVLQPVLQYGQQGRFWMVQSWFVWGAQGISYTAPAISASPGDAIDSYMLYDSTSQTWTCYAINKNTGKTSDLQLTRAKIQNTDFQYAMLVLETVMPNTNYCNLYPGGDDKIIFSNVKVNNAVPKWTTQVAEHDCSQAATVNADNTVTFSWVNK
jgi:hypothetical protein